jgi:proline dehydrogenase
MAGDVGDDPVVASFSRRLLLALATNEWLERAVLMVPGGEQRARRLAAPYVAGTTIEDAVAVARDLAQHQITSSIDFFGENVIDPAEADRVAAAYVELAGDLGGAPPGTFLSVDLSHLGIDRPDDGARRRLQRIAEALPDGSRVQVGAEQAARTDRILAAVTAVARSGAPVSATLQANLRRSEADGLALVQEGVPIRLVKGAYLEDPAQSHRWGEATDLAFVRLAHELHGAGAAISLGTHDSVLREALIRALPAVGVEMLLGVRPDDARTLAAAAIAVRVYVPYGDAWFRYAMRRFAESRGA